MLSALGQTIIIVQDTGGDVAGWDWFWLAAFLVVFCGACWYLIRREW